MGGHRAGRAILLGAARPWSEPSKYAAEFLQGDSACLRRPVANPVCFLTNLANLGLTTLALGVALGLTTLALGVALA